MKKISFEVMDARGNKAFKHRYEVEAPNRAPNSFFVRLTEHDCARVFHNGTAWEVGNVLDCIGGNMKPRELPQAQVCVE